MIEAKYLKLEKANLNAAQNMVVKQIKLKRRKYWGELTDG